MTLILILLSCELAAQATFTYGNLLRVKFDQKEVSLQDTTGKWFNIRAQYNNGVVFEYLKYYEHFTMLGKEYFLTKYYTSDDRPIYGCSDGRRFLESSKYPRGREFGITIDRYWDVPSPFMIDRSQIVPTTNGSWLISGDFHNAFLYNNDSLLTRRVILDTAPAWYSLKSIVGKVGGKYLWAASFKGNYEYYLSEPGEFPIIDTAKAVKVTFTNNELSYYNTVISVKNIRNDLYAVVKFRRRGIDIYRLVGNTFYFVKNTMNNEFQSYSYHPLWDCRNALIYQINNFRLEKFAFNSTDSTFGSRQVFLDSLKLIEFDMVGNYGIDNNYRYLARIYRSYNTDIPDTLKIYDVERAEFINSIILKGIKGANTPIVDSPFVYIHQITKQYTETAVDEPQGSSPKTYSLTAFPNPFNPSTTIRYSIPEASIVTLKVFDILGKEVKTLVKEFKSSGVYDFEFNGTELPSGMYVYTLQTGNYRESKKLILLK